MSTLARSLLLLVVLVAAGCAVQPTQGPARSGITWSDDPDVPPAAREVILQALALIGTPYRYGGTDPATGLDCSGLVRHVFLKVTGNRLPADTQGLSRAGSAVDPQALRPGDLVFFNTLRRSYSHVGIYLGGQRFVHAPSSGGSVEIVSMTQRYWRERYDGARRLREFQVATNP